MHVHGSADGYAHAREEGFKVSAVHCLEARLEEAIVRKEHRAIVDKRIDAP